MSMSKKKTIIIAIIATLIFCALCGFCGAMAVSIGLIHQLERDRPMPEDYPGYNKGWEEDSDNGHVDGHYLTQVTFGEMFEFKGLEIIFHDKIVWADSLAGVFLVPMTVTNASGASVDLGLINYIQYNQSHYRLEDSDVHHSDNLRSAGMISSGATIETFMVFYYDEDGDYMVEFTQQHPSKTMETIQVTLPIKMPI